MDIKNKISQLLRKEENHRAKEAYDQRTLSNNDDISVFNNNGVNVEDKSYNLIENGYGECSITNEKEKENIFEKILSSIKEFFQKEDKTENITDEARNNETTPTNQTNNVEEIQTVQTVPVEEPNTVKMTDSNTINGEIDEKFSQGHTGDCVLLSTILSLSYTEKGANILKESINTITNQNGEIEGYSVNFAGINETYTISKEELEEREYEATTKVKMSDEELIEILGYTEEEVKNMREEDKIIESHAYNPYSNGDSDVLLLELATEKCFNESEHPFIKSFVSAIQEQRNEFSIDKSMLNLEGVAPNILARMFTGNNSTEKLTSHSQILDNLNNGNSIILGTGNRNSILKDIENREVTLFGQHAYAVKSATNDTITIVNPHDSSVELTFNKDALSNLDGLTFNAYNLR